MHTELIIKSLCAAFVCCCLFGRIALGRSARHLFNWSPGPTPGPQNRLLLTAQYPLANFVENSKIRRSGLRKMPTG